MPLTQETKRLYNTFVGSDSITFDVLPKNAAAEQIQAGNKAWSAGGWTQVATTAEFNSMSGTKDAWLCGIMFDDPSADVEMEAEVGLGSTPASALGRWPVSDAYVPINPFRKISASTEVRAQLRSPTTTQHTVKVKLAFAKGL